MLTLIFIFDSLPERVKNRSLVQEGERERETEREIEIERERDRQADRKSETGI